MQQAFLKRPNADDVNCVCSKIQLRCKCCTLTEVVCIQKHLCHDRSARSLSRTTSIFLIPSQSWPALLLNMGDTTALSHSMKPVRNAQDRSSLGPEARPFKSDRTAGDVHIGDQPIRQLDSSFTKVEQFADVLMYHPLDIPQHMFDNIYKICPESRLGELPEPFSLRKIPNVPYSSQIVILSCQPPTGGDPTGSYYHIFKHVYLHKNKIGAKECMDMCYGNPVKFEWGSQTRVALLGLNYMMDRMGVNKSDIGQSSLNSKRKSPLTSILVRMDTGLSESVGRA